MRTCGRVEVIAINCVCAGSQSENFYNMKISALGCEKADEFGKSVSSRDSCGAFCFLMYSISDFTALNSEEQNWRKPIYEKRNAYVRGRNAIGWHLFGECTCSGTGATSSIQYFEVNKSGDFICY
jgi:hypothetical protein